MTSAIDWTVTERGRGRTLLLVHGFTGTSASWGAHLAAFAEHAFVVAPDLPGHGWTPATQSPVEMTVEATADELADLLGRSNLLPADVVGYSMGARIALRLAITHPAAVRRLVLESPSAGIGDAAARAERRAADEALADRIERDGIDAFVDEWERMPVFAAHAGADPALLEAQRLIRRHQNPDGLAASLRAAGQGAMEPLHERLAEVNAPTLVIAGALDTIGRSRAEAIAAGIPRARLAILDGAGHTPHLETPDTFRRLVLDFLEEPAA